MTALLVPDRAHLPDFVAALRRDWSPSTTRNLCAEQLAVIEAGADAFLHRLAHPAGTTTTNKEGESVPALPGTTRWIWGDGFCGSINLRYQPGTVDLPDTVSGHIGYSVVPWRHRQGHGTAALRLMLPVAASVGLPYVIVTCNTDNTGSQKVIEANGGVFLNEAEDTLVPRHTQACIPDIVALTATGSRAGGRQLLHYLYTLSRWQEKVAADEGG